MPIIRARPFLVATALLDPVTIVRRGPGPRAYLPTNVPRVLREVLLWVRFEASLAVVACFGTVFAL